MTMSETETETELRQILGQMSLSQMTPMILTNQMIQVIRNLQVTLMARKAPKDQKISILTREEVMEAKASLIQILEILEDTTEEAIDDQKGEWTGPFDS
jgi:hypothetical protein